MCGHAWQATLQPTRRPTPLGFAARTVRPSPPWCLSRPTTTTTALPRRRGLATGHRPKFSSASVLSRSLVFIYFLNHGFDLLGFFVWFLVSFAQAAAQTVQSQLQSVLIKGDLAGIDERVPFRTPIDDYDVVLHLRHTKLPAARYAIDEPSAAAGASAEVIAPTHTCC